MISLNFVGIGGKKYFGNFNFTNSPPTTNLTQHDSHGPDDRINTIHYHHLSMSRVDGMIMSMELVGSMDVIW
jgi:hypothetical protein